MSRRFIAPAIGCLLVGFIIGWLVYDGPASSRPSTILEPSTGQSSADREPVECTEVYGRFVGVHEGRVAVFAGTPDGCRVLLAIQPWAVMDLPPFQREDLQRGIVFERDEDLFQIFEGLSLP